MSIITKGMKGNLITKGYFGKTIQLLLGEAKSSAISLAKTVKSLIM